MWQKAEKKVYEYQSWQDDFVESKRQDYSLKKDYQWIKDGFFYQVASAILYGIAYGIGFLYCKCVLHVKMKNREILKKYRGMGYLFNHGRALIR